MEIYVKFLEKDIEALLVHRKELEITYRYIEEHELKEYGYTKGNEKKLVEDITNDNYPTDIEEYESIKELEDDLTGFKKNDGYVKV